MGTLVLIAIILMVANIILFIFFLVKKNIILYNNIEIFYWEYDFKNELITYSNGKYKLKFVKKSEFNKFLDKKSLIRLNRIFKGEINSVKINTDHFTGIKEDYIVYSKDRDGDILKGIIVPLKNIAECNNTVIERELYKEVLNKIPYGAAIRNEKGEIIKKNRIFFKQFGSLKKDIATEIINIIKNNNKKIDIFDNEEYYEYYSEEDNKYYYLKIENREIILKKYNKKYTLETIENVTEKVDKVERLRKFKEIVKQAPISIALTDINATVQYVNPKFCNLTGYTKEELIGNNPSVLKSGHTTQKEYEMLWKTILNGYTWKGEFQNKNKNGDLFMEKAIISPLKNNNNEIIGFMGVKEDITARKKIEFELLRSENKFKAIIKEVPFIIFRYDKDGKILFKNNQFYDRIYSNFEESNLNINNIFEPYILNDLLDSYIDEFEVKRITYKGIEVCEKWIKRKIINDYINETQVIILDISRDKKIEEFLYLAKKKAEAADKAKSAFIANISHEIRTPLNGIIGFASILVDEEKEKEKLEMLNLILNSGENLIMIINNILDMSKLEAGKETLKLKSIDLNKLLENVYMLFSKIADEKKLKFKLDSVNFTNNIFIDNIKLTQILNNLLSNAIKFTEKGEIVLKISDKVRGNNKHYLEIIVKDTGIGIPKESIKDVFESFKQIENTLTKEYKGTGLGLSIVEKMVELMGGEIKVESEFGKGTTFTLYLPLKYSEDIKLTKNNTEKINIGIEKSIEKRKVLLVEDNVINQKLVQTLLDRYNLECDIVESGKKAVEKALEGEYIFILLDIQLLELDGYCVAKQIREKEKKRNTIIAITAYAMKENRDKCFEVGMDEYISKPVDKEEFYKIISKYIQ